MMEEVKETCRTGSHAGDSFLYEGATDFLTAMKVSQF